MISILVGSLTMYYTDSRCRYKYEEGVHHDQKQASYVIQDTKNQAPHIIFAAAYIALLIPLGIFYGLGYENPQYNDLFEPWQQFSAPNVIKLTPQLLYLSSFQAMQ